MPISKTLNQPNPTQPNAQPARLPDDGQSVRLPHGRTSGSADAPVKLTVSHWSSIARLKAGQIGALATDYVEGKVPLDGAMRDVMQTMARLLTGKPTTLADPWWRHLL